jgi:hypothetical protein
MNIPTTQHLRATIDDLRADLAGVMLHNPPEEVRQQLEEAIETLEDIYIARMVVPLKKNKPTA